MLFYCVIIKKKKKLLYWQLIFRLECNVLCVIGVLKIRLCKIVIIFEVITSLTV